MEVNHKNHVFIVYEWRHNDLHDLMIENDTGKVVMGEVTWFYCLMKHLMDKNYKVIHCENENDFLTVYNYEKEHNIIHLIMDFATIPKTIHHLYDNIKNIYCMCFWGRDTNTLKELGCINDTYISISNILTPFNYFNENTYLGFDIKYLCNSFNTNLYENIGILWGKDINHINLNLVEYLTSRGLLFYSVANYPVNINGVINLGILSKKIWRQLLNDGKYVLSFGNPQSGTTILEALFYKNILFGPQSQYPKSVYNKNIMFTDNLSNEEIYSLIIQNRNHFIEHDEVCNSLINNDNYSLRIQNIFNLDS